MISHSLTSRHHLYSCKFISYLVCDFSNQHSGIKVFARNLFKFCGFNDGFGIFLSHETVVFDFTLYWLDKTNLHVGHLALFVNYPFKYLETSILGDIFLQAYICRERINAE